MLDPADRLEARGAPARGRQQADREVGARPLVVERVEAALGQPLGGADQRVGARAPGGDRVVLVQPQHVQQLAPRAAPAARSSSRSGKTRSAQTWRRARADRPVRRALVHDLDALAYRRQPVLADEHRIEVGHQPGRARAGQRDPRGALVAQREHPLAVPGRHELERLRARVLDPGALDVGVEPADVDELRAVPVRARRQRAHEVLLAGLAADRDDLVLLHVGAEADIRSANRARVASSIRRQATRSTRYRRPCALGGVREWLNRAVSKTVVRATVPRVRIPPPPPRDSARSRITARVARRPCARRSGCGTCVARRVVRASRRHHREPYH